MTQLIREKSDARATAEWSVDSNKDANLASEEGFLFQTPLQSLVIKQGLDCLLRHKTENPPPLKFDFCRDKTS